jgi:hypothetical protein
MQRRLYPTVVFVAAFLAGCATHRQAIPSQLTIVDLPQLGEERIAERGETLVQKGRMYTYDAVRLENKISGGNRHFAKLFSLEPGILKATMRDEKRIYYTTDRLAVYDTIDGTQMDNGGLAISTTTPSDIKFYWNEQLQDVPKPVPVLAKTQAPDSERPNFRHELIYNGRSGDTINLIYREYFGERMSAQLIQGIQYNLKNGTTFGFRGARIEVIEATDTRIKYRVIAGFPDAP